MQQRGRNRTMGRCDKDWRPTIELITKKLCTDIRGRQRMNHTDFGDPLNFALAPPLSLHLWFCVKCLNNCWINVFQTFMSYSG